MVLAAIICLFLLGMVVLQEEHQSYWLLLAACCFGLVGVFTDTEKSVMPQKILLAKVHPPLYGKTFVNGGLG